MKTILALLSVLILINCGETTDSTTGVAGVIDTIIEYDTISKRDTIIKENSGEDETRIDTTVFFDSQLVVIDTTLFDTNFIVDTVIFFDTNFIDSDSDSSIDIDTSGLRIYYIRHAEAGHNVTGEWEESGIPEDEWPDYVGDANQFTPEGLEQVATVSERLQSLVPNGFDFIAASPTWRTRNTILDYMKELGLTGEVWPELTERNVDDDYLLLDLPEITEPVLGQGSAYWLPDEELDWYSFRANGENRDVIPESAQDDPELEAAAGKIIIQNIIDLILEKYDGTNKTVLLSGHNSNGRALIRLLTNELNPLFGGIENTGIWMVEQQPDGTFDVIMYNNVVVSEESD